MESRARRTEVLMQEAAAEIGELTDRELWLAGVMAYWCEGSKTKSWDTSRQVTFVNSDPDLIRLFLAWTRLLGVAREDLIYRVSIHESGDVAAAHGYWAAVVGEMVERFARPTLKRHTPKTRRNTPGDDYHGCLTVRVRRSTGLNRQLTGWFDGISNAVCGSRGLVQA